MEGVPLDGKNLIVQAFDIFRAKTGKAAFFRCAIDKQTPMEGGMGGGSSNCATALWAANRLCGDPASDEDLIEWGGELGRSRAPPRARAGAPPAASPALILVFCAHAGAAAT